MSNSCSRRSLTSQTKPKKPTTKASKKADAINTISCWTLLTSLEDKVHQYRHKIADLQPLLQECYNQESRVQQRDQYAHKFRHEQPQSDKQTLFPSPTEQRQQQPPDYHQATGSTASAPSEKLMDMMALPFDNARTAEIRRMAAVLRIASTTIRAARCVKQSKL